MAMCKEVKILPCSGCQNLEHIIILQYQINTKHLIYYNNNLFIAFTEMIQYIYSAIPDIPKSYTPTLMRRINTPIKDSDSEGEKRGMF